MEEIILEGEGHSLENPINETTEEQPAQYSLENSIDTAEAPAQSNILEQPLLARAETAQEEICRTEFGFNLANLLEKLGDVKTQAKDLEIDISQFALLHACDTYDFRDYGSFFMQEMLSISRLASENILNAFISMHCTVLKNMQAEMKQLHLELASSKAAIQALELEKAGFEEAAQQQRESDKALLEASLRAELQTCQICHVNNRNTVILPCFHGQYCGDCLNVYQRTNQACPTCRGIIRGMHPYIA